MNTYTHLKPPKKKGRKKNISTEENNTEKFSILFEKRGGGGKEKKRFYRTLLLSGVGGIGKCSFSQIICIDTHSQWEKNIKRKWLCRYDFAGKSFSKLSIETFKLCQFYDRHHGNLNSQQCALGYLSLWPCSTQLFSIKIPFSEKVTKVQRNKKISGMLCVMGPRERESNAKEEKKSKEQMRKAN